MILPSIMPITARAIWNPEVELEKADKVDVVVNISDVASYDFHKVLDDGRKLGNYLGGVRYYGAGDYGLGHHWSSRPTQQSGEKSFVLISDSFGLNQKPIAPIDYEKFISGNKFFHQPFYMIIRNESIDHERYCAFYGSSGFVWDISLCDYSRAGFPEKILQTFYDMVHENEYIYAWTNVWTPFMRDYDRDGPAKTFFEKELKPRLALMKSHATKAQLEDFIDTLETIPEYKKYSLHSLIVERK